MKAMLAALALIAFAAPAAGETRRFAIDDFHAIEASGQFRIEYAHGPVAALILDGNSGDIARLRVSTRNGELNIRHNCTFFCNRALNVVARVSGPALDRLELAKGITFRADAIAAGDLSVNIAMGATAHLTGACANLEVRAAMGATLDARELQCRTATVQASMGGTARVSAEHSIDASASMGGDIRVSGDPERRRQQASMGGSVSVQ